MKTFLECETMFRLSRATTWTRVRGIVGRLAEIDPRKVAEVVRVSRDKKKQRLCDPFFALCPKPVVRFRWKRARLSLFRPQPHLPSFIQIHPSFRDLFAKTTFQTITIYCDPILTTVWVQRLWQSDAEEREV